MWYRFVIGATLQAQCHNFHRKIVGYWFVSMGDTQLDSNKTTSWRCQQQSTMPWETSRQIWDPFLNWQLWSRNPLSEALIWKEHPQAFQLQSSVQILSRDKHRMKPLRATPSGRAGDINRRALSSCLKRKSSHHSPNPSSTDKTT